MRRERGRNVAPMVAGDYESVTTGMRVGEKKRGLRCSTRRIYSTVSYLVGFVKTFSRVLTRRSPGSGQLGSAWLRLAQVGSARLGLARRRVID